MKQPPPPAPPHAILLYGGSFDPIHHGHLISAAAAAELLGIARVVLIPCGQSPFKPADQLSAPAHRLAMCRIAAAADPRFDVSEFELERAGPSYTIETVRYFRETQPGAPLYWLIGADSLPHLPKWKDSAELLQLCNFVVATRPDAPPIDWSAVEAALGAALAAQLRAHLLATPAVDISSTEIRARARVGRAVTWLVPEAVRVYIAEHRLYLARPH